MNRKFILLLILFIGFFTINQDVGYSQIVIRSEASGGFHQKTELFQTDGNYIYLPLRAVTEKLGYEVEYQPKSRLVRLIYGKDITDIFLDTGRADINGQEIDLTYKPLIINNRVFLRVDFFSEILGCLVTVNSDYTDIVIEHKRDNPEDFFQKSGEDDKTIGLSNLIESYVNKQNFQGSVLVAQGGKILLNEGYGLSNKELYVVNKSQTKYPIGSISKQFVGTGIIKLEEEGKLKFDDKLSKYLDGFTHGDQISLDNLLTHRSGLYPVTNIPEFYKLKGQGPEEIVNLVGNRDLLFKPGEKFEYNNTNYIVLGMILESVSGMTLEEYFEVNFFRPLNMLDTGIMYGSKNFDIATPYQGYIDIYEVKEEPLLLNIYGAGNVYSTVEDMYRWNEALKGDSILSQSGKDKLFKSNVRMNEDIMYSYGWMLGVDKYGRFYEHDGSTLGSSAINRKNLDKDTTIIILGNRRLEEVFEMAYSIEEVLTGNEVGEENIWGLPEEIEISKEEKEKYVGVYSIHDPISGEDTHIEISLEENLYLLIDGQVNLEIFYKGNNEFFTKRKEKTLVFSIDDDGVFSRVQLRQSGIIYAGYRLGYESSKLEMDRRLLEGYVGIYEVENGMRFSIELLDNKLYSTLDSGKSMELIPVSETKFDFSIGRGCIEFILDEHGEVIKVNYEKEDL